MRRSDDGRIDRRARRADCVSAVWRISKAEARTLVCGGYVVSGFSRTRWEGRASRLGCATVRLAVAQSAEAARPGEELRRENTSEAACVGRRRRSCDRFEPG